MTTHEAIFKLQRRMETAIIGQQHVIERLLLTLLCNGNCLLEGLPGLAKTRAVKSLARHLEAELKRVQFTPDLLPADITGSEMYLGENAQERFVFQPGPIFANLVLADEINRAPAKVQWALLESMEERQVTVSGKTHTLPELFMVLATQNPIEQEGTYPLPETQKDRFLLHVAMGYPDDASEQAIIRLVRAEKGGDAGEALAPISQHVIFDARAEVNRVEVSDAMEKYIVAIIAATRRPRELSTDLGRWIQVGASPRGSLALDYVSRTHAWLHGRDYVTPDDVRAVVNDCLRHRLALSYEANAEGISPDQAINDMSSWWPWLKGRPGEDEPMSPNEIIRQDAAQATAQQARHPVDERVHVSLHRLLRLQHAAAGFSFLPRQPVTSLLSGRHASRLRGRGLNFAEIRAYQAGDDIRMIDWKVTARTREAHSRVFTEERDRPGLLLVDQRVNMFFGTRVYMKSVTAAEAAALSAWRLLKATDRVGALVFNDTQVTHIRPHRGAPTQSMRHRGPVLRQG